VVPSSARDHAGILLAAGAAGLCLAVYTTGRAVPEEDLRALVGGAGPAGPALLTLLILATYVVAPLSSSPLLMIGYQAFGQDVVIYAAAAALASSVVNFWFARSFGRRVVRMVVGQRGLDRVDALAERLGLRLLFALRVFQGGIHEFVSYAAGVTSIRFVPYLAVSTAGMLPGLALWYAASWWVDDPLVFTALSLVLGSALSLAFLAGGLALSKWRRRAGGAEPQASGAEKFATD